MMKFRRLIIGASLATASAMALAHSGHGTHSFAEGLAHPFGLDHLLAMVAVGVWSAVALPAGKRWLGPGTFLLLMSLGAWAGQHGHALPMIEHALALSVAVLGAMLVAPRVVPMGVGLGAVALAAALHGVAHGAELPFGATFSGFLGGFLATTAALHGLGLYLGHGMAAMKARGWQMLGSLLGVSGLLLWVLA